MSYKEQGVGAGILEYFPVLKVLLILELPAFRALLCRSVCREMRELSTDNVFITFDMHLQVLATLLKTLIANTIPDCDRCTAQCTRTLQFHFHLVRSPTIGFHCLSASVASSQTCCYYRYHVRVCTTKIMVLHCMYNDFAVHTALQRFTPETTDKFGVWISLLHSFCDVCYECSFHPKTLTLQSRLDVCICSYSNNFTPAVTVFMAGDDSSTARP